MRRIVRIYVLSLLLLATTPAWAGNGGWDLAREVVTDPHLSRARLAEALSSEHPAARKAALLRIKEWRDTSLRIAAEAALGDSVYSVRRMACWALGEMGETSAGRPLRNLLDRESHAEVICRAMMALGALRDTGCIPRLRAYLADPSFSVRGIAADELGRLGDTASAARLRRLAVEDRTEYVRFRARNALKRFGEILPAPATVAANGPSWRPILLFLLIFVVPFAILIISIVVMVRSRGRRRLVAALTGVLACLSHSYLLNEYVEASSQIDLSVASARFIPVSDGIEGVGPGLSEMARWLLEQGTVDRIVQSDPSALGPADPDRDQYDAVTAIRTLARSGPAKTAIVTMDDLYQDPFYFVMGLGGPHGAVISLRRVDPVFLGEGPGNEEDRAIFLERAAKLVVHEIGHMRDLPHCDRPRCVMNYFETADEYFRVDASWCPACAERLRR